MIDCDSEDEREVASSGGNSSSTNHVQRCLDEKLSAERTCIRCGQVPKSDITPCTHHPSPIYRLSADVLRTIFELFCEVELPMDFPLCYDPPQFIISQVCGAWRQLVMDTPIFWNKIRVTVRECTSYDEMVEAPRMWLSRAKEFPCFIEFEVRPPRPPVSSDSVLWHHEINENIVQDLIFLQKCKGLDVMFADHHLRDLLQLSDEKLTCIEILRLCCVGEDDNRKAVSPLDLHKLSNLASFHSIPTLFYRQILHTVEG